MEVLGLRFALNQLQLGKNEVKHPDRWISQEQHFQAIIAKTAYQAHPHEGTGIDPEERSLNYLQQAYVTYPFQQSRLESLSYVSGYQDAIALKNDATKELFFGIRGSTFSDPRDVLNVAPIALFGNAPLRNQSVENWIGDVMQHFLGYTVTISGHSAAGPYAINAGKALGVNAVYTFNAAGTPLFSFMSRPLSGEPQIINTRFEGDFVSNMRVPSNNEHNHVYPSHTDIGNHTIDNVLDYSNVYYPPPHCDSPIEDKNAQVLLALGHSHDACYVSLDYSHPGENIYFSTSTQITSFTDPNGVVTNSESLILWLTPHAQAAMDFASYTSIDQSLNWVLSTSQGRMSCPQLMKAIISKAGTQAFVQSVLSKDILQRVVGMSPYASKHTASALFQGVLSFAQGDSKAAGQAVVQSLASHALQQGTGLPLGFSSSNTQINTGLFGETRKEQIHSDKVSASNGVVTISMGRTRRDYMYSKHGEFVSGHSSGAEGSIAIIGGISVSGGFHSGSECSAPITTVSNGEITTSYWEKTFSGRYQLMFTVGDRSSHIGHFPAWKKHKITTVVRNKEDGSPYHTSFSPSPNKSLSVEDAIANSPLSPPRNNNHAAVASANLSVKESGATTQINYFKTEYHKKKACFGLRTKKWNDDFAGGIKSNTESNAYSTSFDGRQRTGVKTTTTSQAFEVKIAHNHIPHDPITTSEHMLDTVTQNTYVESNIDGSPINPTTTSTTRDLRSTTTQTNSDMHILSDTTTIIGISSNQRNKMHSEYIIGDFMRDVDHDMITTENYNGKGHIQLQKTTQCQVGNYQYQSQKTINDIPVTFEPCHTEVVTMEHTNLTTIQEIDPLIHKESGQVAGVQGIVNYELQYQHQSHDTTVTYAEGGNLLEISSVNMMRGEFNVLQHISSTVIAPSSITTSGSLGPITKPVQHHHFTYAFGDVSCTVGVLQQNFDGTNEILKQEAIYDPMTHNVALTGTLVMDTHMYTGQDGGPICPPLTINEESSDNYHHTTTRTAKKVFDQFIPSVSFAQRTIQGVQAESTTHTNSEITDPFLFLRTTLTEHTLQWRNYEDVSEITVDNGLSSTTQGHTINLDDYHFTQTSTIQQTEGFFYDTAKVKTVTLEGGNIDTSDLQYDVLNAASCAGVSTIAGGLTTMLLRYFEDGEMLTDNQMASLALAGTKSFALAHVRKCLLSLSDKTAACKILGGTFVGTTLLTVLKFLVEHSSTDEVDNCINFTAEIIGTIVPLVLLFKYTQEIIPWLNGVAAIVEGIQQTIIAWRHPSGIGRRFDLARAITTTATPAIVGASVVYGFASGSFAATTLLGSAVAAAIPAATCAAAIYVTKKVINKAFDVFTSLQLKKKYAAYCTRFGVRNTATSEEIRAAYRKQALKVHPDKYGGSKDKFLALTDMLSEMDQIREKLNMNSNQSGSERTYWSALRALFSAPRKTRARDALVLALMN